MTPRADPAVAAAVADAHRHEWAFVLAATVRVTRDLDLAEECVQDAYARALSAWTASGVPARPGAWLTTAARNRALDLLRHEATARRALPLLVEDAVVPPPDEVADEAGPPGLASVAAGSGAAWDGGPGDDRLRLVFTCCHPALAPEARVALSLRLLCGLSTAEVAHAFLVSEPTMAARLTRAKKKIAAARIPYRVPEPEELKDRVGAVCDTVHLLFTTGHSAPAGDELVRRDLVQRALDLARMLHRLLPCDAEVSGLLALLLLTDARRDARLDAEGRVVLLVDQDRSRWDQAAVAEGIALLRDALRRQPGRWALMAAIAAVHDEAPSWAETDWREVVGLYDVLVQVWPSPVVALNRAVAVGMAGGPAAGLAALDALGGEPQLAGYPYLAAARADLLRRLGRLEEARTAYDEAILLTENAVERRFLSERRTELDGEEPDPQR